jgi:hypothetical protein
VNNDWEEVKAAATAKENARIVAALELLGRKGVVNVWYDDGGWFVEMTCSPGYPTVRKSRSLRVALERCVKEVRDE